MGRSREEWIEKALDEVHPVTEMAEEIIRDSERDKLNVYAAHFICSAIEDHGRTAKRYLSYAARCKEE